MRVRVQDGLRVVAEPSSHHVKGHGRVRAERQRGRCVTQAVQTADRNACRLAQSPERHAEAVGAKPPPELVTEDEVAVLVGRPGEAALEQLGGNVMP